MKTRMLVKLMVAGALMTVPLVPRAAAQEDQPASQPSPAPPAKDAAHGDMANPAEVPSVRGDARAQAQLSTTTGSAGIADLLKLADAKVAPEVIKAYIENAAIAYDPTVQDILSLKEHDVPDALITALIQRGAEVRSQADRAATAQADLTATPNAPAPVITATTALPVQPVYEGLDPESYDYFRYYYLYPRTLASVYQRLAPYDYQRFSYGYWGPGPYLPRYPAMYPYPRTGRGGFSGGTSSFRRSPAVRSYPTPGTRAHTPGR